MPLELAIDDDEPDVPVLDVELPLALDGALLPGCALVRMNPADADADALGLLEAVLPAVELVPDVPVVPLIEPLPEGCKQPVTVIVLLLVLEDV